MGISQTVRGRLVTGGCVIAVVISIVCLVLTIIAVSDRDSQQTEIVLGGPCVRCETLKEAHRKKETRVNDNVFAGMSTHVQNGEKMCCVSDSKQMSTLIKLILDQEESGNTEAEMKSSLQQLSNSRRPSAHLHLQPYATHNVSHGNKSEMSSSSYLPLKFYSGHQNVFSEHAENVLVLPSGIVILKSGLYQVYSNVLLKATEGRSCSDYEVKTWEYQVVKSRPSHMTQSGTILRALHICCDGCQSQRETNYAAGVFLLEAGDHLHVHVSAPAMVSFQPETSYVGLAMLGAAEISQDK